MTYKEQIDLVLAKTRKVWVTENAKFPVHEIISATLKEITDFDYSKIDTLDGGTLEKHMGAWTQHYFYMNRYINGLSMAINEVQNFVNQVVTQASLNEKYKDEKSDKAKEKKALSDLDEIREIEVGLLADMRSREKFYENEIKGMELFIQSIKKALDKFNKYSPGTPHE